jgi:DNA-binding CsgD family transcriptional regulator
MSVERERLSGIIGAIYDCVIVPETWPRTLKSIIEEVHDVINFSMTLHILVDIDDEMIAGGMVYGQEIAAIWGGVRTLIEAPLDEPIVQSEATPRAAWHSNAWYRNILEPRGLHDAVTIPLVRDSRTLGVIAFGRYIDSGPFLDEEIAGLRLIAPHLRRAVIISRLLEQEAAMSATFSEVLQHIAAGAILVDETMTIVHANAAGRAMLETGDPIGIQNEKLVLTNAVTNSVLANAVSQAARRDGDLERRSIDIPARTSHGRPAIIQVLPLRHRKIAQGVEQRVAAAVFIANAADPPRLPADAMALLYDLTPAEVRIFELIIAGHTPSEIAMQLNIALATVKSHLSRVFDKTGCARQSDLVAMAAKVTLTV